MKVVWNGNEQLRPFLTPLHRLHLDPKNARLHDPQNLQAIRDSLARFGQQLPLIALKSGKVIVGNGRLTVIRAGWTDVWKDGIATGTGQMNWTHAAALLFDREEDAATAMAIIDNRSAELASWDYELLGATLKNLMALGWETPQLGWLAPQAQPLLAGEWVPVETGTGLLDAPQLGRPVQLTVKERKALDKAVAMMREEVKKPELAEGAVVERLAREYVKHEPGKQGTNGGVAAARPRRR